MIEGVLSPEEAQALRTEKEAHATELAAAKQRLVGLENKDYNFRKLESMTQEEINKLSATELEIKKDQEKLRADQEAFSQKQIESAKRSALNMVAAGDDELQAKILANYDRIKDEATTEEEIRNKMYEAYTLTTAIGPAENPLAQAMTFTGGKPPVNKTESFAETERGKDLAASLGMNIAKQEKK